ncbi:YpmS family protein [Sporosarcina sp. ACRSM]|uniref:YpmS family protein n=1 Tax=Sporosarcina sp. ACRSM TaxID=2918216 RepID=UPI001EF4F9C5|nr:YpmS family protein [Sporosarcina sp. ACRSM]MCG7334514.1 YpmS family protein [Sporosarcina sp. ACRSM]
MNRWKIGFFLLAGLIVAVVAYIIFLIGSPGDSEPLPEVKIEDTSDHVLTVKVAKEDFEGIANTYIGKAVKGEPLPVTMVVRDDVVLLSEMMVFSLKLPVIMHFDPLVREDGNLILKLSSMEIGQLKIQPSTVLTILRDSVKLPPWMIVRPKEEEVFIDLTKLPLSGNLKVRAKTFNLAEDEIILEIIIPKE